MPYYRRVGEIPRMGEYPPMMSLMLYNGDACLRGNGFWWMRAFTAS